MEKTELGGAMTLFLVRHGEAEHNVLGVGSSQPEITERHLTKKGKAQIREVAKRLAGRKIDAIISSPFVRTRETATVISEATGVPVLIDDRLHETGLGIFNERPIELFFKKYPEPETRIVPDEEDGVESFLDMRSRLSSFLRDLSKYYAGKTVVIVSHGDPLEQLHGIIVGEAPGVSATGWYPKQGSCTEVVWRGE